MKQLLHTHKNPISLILAAVILFGVFFYSRIQVSLFPEITFPKIKIIADNGEQPVDKMLISVTRPIENAVKQVPGIYLIRSATSRGSCEISAFLNRSANIDQSLQMLELRLNQIKNILPPTVEVQIEKMNPSILPVMGFALESKTKTPIELNFIANYVVKPFFSQVEGVSEVRITGGKTKEFHLVLNPLKMSAYGITPEMVSNAISQGNFIISNGYLQDYKRMYLTVTDAGLRNISDLEQMIIKNDGRRLIRMKDIAGIEVKERIEYMKVNANGKEALLIAILKQPDANLVNLSREILSKKKDLEHLLPKGVFLTPYYNQADFVNDAVNSVNDSIWLGLILAIIVAVLFLRSFKASVTILITLPVTLFLTLIILYAVGYTLNIMTLGAIAAAIGLLIDDAVIVTEQIHRSREELPDLDIKAVVHQSMHFLLPSMIGSTLCTVVIFIPFLLMSGVAGSYFNVLTNTMIVTLICSFFVTWLGLPVIYTFLSRIKIKSKLLKQPEITVIKNRKFVPYFIQRPYISIVFVVILIASALFIIPGLETGFLPEMDEGSIVLDYNSPPGTSLPETDRMLREVEKIIVKIPEYESYSRRTGTQMGFFITEPNNGDYLIQLKKDRKRKTEAVIDDLRYRIETAQPALRVDFGQVIGDMLGDLMESVQPVEIKIFGNDQKKLNELATKVAAFVERVPGTADVFNGITIAGPSIDVRPDIEKLALYGISPANFQVQLKTHLEGTIVGSIPEKEQYTNIRMVYADNFLSGVDKTKQQLIFLPDGKLKPFSEFAEIKLNAGSPEIIRENLQSVAIITARLNERDLGSVMKDLTASISRLVPLPKGYYYSYGGAYSVQKKSFQELLLILIASGLLVFSLILFLYKDFKVALTILFVAVLGVSGSIIALFLTGTPLNVGSYTGLIMIVGIIGENAIFTFQQFNNKLQNATADDSIIYAISTRLRPKLMTVLSTITALIPLAIGLGAGAQMHQPLAVSVIGGLIVALPLLLVVLPSILRYIYKNKNISL